MDPTKTFVCKLCGATVAKRNLQQHYRLTHISRINFPCPYKGCPSSFKSIRSVSVHVCRFHSTIKASSNGAFNTICRICSTEQRFSTIKDLFMHMKNVHVRLNEKIACLFSKCEFSTRVSGTWSSHFYCSHCQSINLSLLHKEYICESVSCPVESDIVEQEFSEDEDNGPNSTHVIPEPEQAPTHKDIERTIALLFLKMQVVYHIPEYLIQDVFDTFSELRSFQLIGLIDQFSKKLSADGDRLQLLDQIPALLDARQPLSTAYLRKQYFTRQLPYVAPEEMSISSESGRVFKMVYVPILKVLQALFEHTDALKKFSDVCRVNLDFYKVKSLMAVTYAQRRLQITSQIEDISAKGGYRYLFVQEILREWPALRLKLIVLDEFYRITNINISSIWYENLDAIVPKILSLCKQRSTVEGTGLGDEAPDDSSDLILTETREEALRALPGLLHEDPSMFFRVFEPLEVESILTGNMEIDEGAFIAVVADSDTLPKYSIFAEKRVLLEGLSSFSEATVYLLVYHYIFDLQYNARLVLEFLQRTVLKIGTTDKKPSVKLGNILLALNSID